MYVVCYILMLNCFFSLLLLIFNFFPLIFIQRKNKIHIVLPFHLIWLNSRKNEFFCSVVTFFLLIFYAVPMYISLSSTTIWNMEKYTTTFLYYIQIQFTQKKKKWTLYYSVATRNKIIIIMFVCSSKKNFTVHMLSILFVHKQCFVILNLIVLFNEMYSQQRINCITRTLIYYL